MNDQPIYCTSRDECIHREIVAALAEFSEEFDIPAIADDVVHLEPGRGYYVTEDSSEFWRSVQRHEKG